MPLHLLPVPVQVVVAESFGGKDEPVDTLLSSLLDAGAEPLALGAQAATGAAANALRVKELPTQALYQAFEETGRGRAGCRAYKSGMTLRPFVQGF